MAEDNFLQVFMDATHIGAENIVSKPTVVTTAIPPLLIVLCIIRYVDDDKFPEVNNGIFKL
jgi:hypothetical protein